jgi:MFS family permease
MVGIAQAVTGVIAIGMGAWIQWVLGPTGPAYPLNYIWLFGVATVCYGLSMASNVFIVEIPESVEDQRPSLRRYLPQLVELWKSDKAFSRVTTARLLVGLGGLATTFYVVYATEVLQLPASAIGLYATATTLGSAFAGLTLGAVASRFGSQRVVQITCWVEVCIPLFALLCYTGTLGEALPMLFPLLFFLLGVFEGSIMLGFMNFVLEIAPAGQRPTYMGLTNTLSGLMVLIPLIGGVILKYTSYPVLFILAAVGTFLGALVAMGLRNPRQPALPTETPLEQVAL